MIYWYISLCHKVSHEVSDTELPGRWQFALPRGGPCQCTAMRDVGQQASLGGVYRTTVPPSQCGTSTLCHRGTVAAAAVFLAELVVINPNARTLQLTPSDAAVLGLGGSLRLKVHSC